MATFQYLPLDVHIVIAKLLNLKESLTYSQLCTITFDAVYYVFAHRKQLDFMSCWGPNNKIALSDAMILKVMHAHTRAEVITGFNVPITFSSFAALKNYMECYWGNVEDEGVDERGHETGQLIKITYPRTTCTYWGGANRQQGQELLSIWVSFSDSYGVFGVQQDTIEFPDYPPLNNAASNWSTVDLDAPYSRDYECGPWKSERVWEIKCKLSQRYYEMYGELPDADQLATMDIDYN